MHHINMRCFSMLVIFSFAGMFLFAQRKPVAKKTPIVAAENTQVKNGVKFTANGFKVSEAYLVLDDESLVPEDNKVKLNQNVNLVLIIDEGWAVTDGRVYPGSKQQIKLNTGVEILNSEDLFAAFDEAGVSPEDARYITLNATITEIKDKKKNYVIVNFNVWDKKGSSTIKGSYKLYIK